MKKKTAYRAPRAHHAPHFYIIFAMVMIFAGAFAALVATKVVGQTSTQMIYACAQKNTGNLRMVSAGTTCNPSEVAVAWNQQGPQGPAGPAGSAGQGVTSGLPFSCNICNLAPFASQFKGKDFSGAQLYGVEFSGTDLTGVIFKGSFFNQDGFNNTNLSNADFSNIRDVSGDILGSINNLEFRNANLTNANFSNSQFTNSYFNGANLQGTNFSNTTVTRTNFQGAQNMSTANVTGVTWNSVTCPDGSNSNDNGNTCTGHF